MTTVYVISKDGQKLMPTLRNGRVRHLLKEGKAKIYKYHPFTVQLTYDTPDKTQPIEIGMDAGYQNIGVSVKTKQKELFSAEFELLSDEKSRHDDCRKYRRIRRNRLRYRKPRWNNRTHSKPEGWLAPSIQHKAEAHIKIIKDICSVAPVKTVTVEVGEFDPALLKAMYEGKEPPQGKDYQQGTMYFADSLRKAVFQRDNYTCQICKKSVLKDKNVVLKTHHALFWKGRHSNSLNELMTVCEKCHTPANHQPGGKLYGLEPRLSRLEGATYMNEVRWKIINTLRDNLAGVDINFCYGAQTSRKRKDLGIEKSHANDAYCIGNLQPKRRPVKTVFFVKKRRNSRILEKFYDAKYTDIRDGKLKKGAELSSGRTNRRTPRNNENNLRIYRGLKKSKGRRVIRKTRYLYQPNDIVFFNSKKYKVKGVQNLGAYIALYDYKPIAVTKVQLYKHVNSWIS